MPDIKYYDPQGDASSISARLALNVYRQMDILDSIQDNWSKENRTAQLVILDRTVDPFIPLIHSLCYHAAIQDLLSVDENLV